MMLDSAECLRQVMAMQGAIGAHLVDTTTGLSVGSAGRAPNGDHRVTAAGVADLLHATLSSGAIATVGRPGSVDDIVVTAGNGYHLMHVVGGRSAAPLLLYVWLDRTTGNLAMAQRRMRAATSELVAG